MERTARRMLGTMTAAMKMTPSDRDFTDVPPPSLYQESARLSPILDFLACGLAFVPVVPLLMMSPTLTLGGTFVWEFYGKLDG